MVACMAKGGQAADRFTRFTLLGTVSTLHS